MRKSFPIILVIFILSTLNIIAENDELFVRHPDLNSDGSKITFNFQGDIWIAN